MGVFGNKNMVFDSGGLLKDLILYQRFNDGNVEDQLNNSIVTRNGIGSENGLYSDLPDGSARINSNTDYVMIVDSDLFSFGDGVEDKDFSFSFAFKPYNLGVIDGSFYTKFLFSKRGVDGGAGNQYREWQVILSNSQTEPKLEMVLFNESTLGSARYTGSTTLTNNVSYYVTISHSNGSVSMKINDIEETVTKTINGTYVAMENTISPFKIGSSGWSNLFHCDMNIDGLGVWKRALSGNESTLIYNIQSSGKELL